MEAVIQDVTRRRREPCQLETDYAMDEHLCKWSDDADLSPVGFIFWSDQRYSYVFRQSKWQRGPVPIAYEYIPQSNIAVHHTDLSGRVLEDKHENGTSAGQRRRGRLTFRSDMEAVAIYKMWFQ